MFKLEAHFAQARQSLGTVWTECDGAPHRCALQEVPRGRARAHGETPLPQLAHQTTSAGGAPSGLVVGFATGERRDALSRQVAQIHREERRPQQRGLGDAVLGIRQRPQAQQELTVQRVREKECAGRG